jgi:hypothetical protein
VWERNPPASFSVARTEAASALASLAPAADGDSELADSPRFDLGDVILADTADGDAEHFDLGPLTLVDLNLLRGLPPSYPETRVGGFELLPPFRVGASASLSLWPRQACGFSCGEVASDSRYDPWGLAIWTSEQIADRYSAESKQFGLLTAIRNEALRRALNKEQDAQGAPPPSLLDRGLSAIGSLFGLAKAADQRVEDVIGDTARDLTRNVVPPSTAPVDRTHRIPTEYGGGPTQSDRIANAANGLSETAGDVAEGGARGGYQVGRDWFFGAGLGKALDEARLLRMQSHRSGHHVPAVRKARGRPFEVGRSDPSRPTLFSKGVDPANDHWRMHAAERGPVGPRQGDFSGTDDELFDAYRRAYAGLDDIHVDVRSPNGGVVLGEGVSPREAVDLIETWLRTQGKR